MKTFQSLGMLLLLAATAACQSHPATDRTPDTPAKEGVTTSDSLARPAATTSTRPIAQTRTARSTAEIPESFSEYASDTLSNGERCIAGATTDEDGMNEKAVVYVTDATDKRPRWVDKLDLPTHTYQSRATHCSFSGQALFVLLQSDTQPEQTLSQTLLRVAKVSIPRQSRGL